MEVLLGILIGEEGCCSQGLSEKSLVNVSVFNVLKFQHYCQYLCYVFLCFQSVLLYCFGGYIVNNLNTYSTHIAVFLLQWV